jgi:uncharacterized protein (TIGR00288 family)
MVGSLKLLKESRIILEKVTMLLRIVFWFHYLKILIWRDKMEQSKIALFIDAENISTKYLEPIMKEIAQNGKIVVARYYGDVRNLNEKWSSLALDNAIKAIHQPNVSSKKNAADMAMALDAQEIMYIGKVDTFYIVSSDSDFTPLASKLKEGGMKVVGIGDERKVSNAFKKSCNEFKYFDYLLEDDTHDSKGNSNIYESNDIEQIIKEIIVENGENNKIQLSIVGDILVNRYSDFDSRKYGAKQLSGLVRTISGIKLTKENTTDYIELTNRNPRNEIFDFIQKIISKNPSKKMKYTKLIEELRKEINGFSYKEYGYNQFKKFLASFPELKVTKEFVSIQNN